MSRRFQQRRQLSGIVFFTLFVCSLLCVTGCPWKSRDAESQDDSRESVAPLAGVSLKLLIVDDCALAATVEKTRGEWLAQTGSQLTVAATNERDLHTAKAIEADAVICPSYMVVDLAERGLIVPIPESALGKNDAYRQDIFELVRLRETVWGESVMAVPFGSPVLICYCRTDLLQHFKVSPPQTWSDYRHLAELFADREKLGNMAPPPDQPWQGAIEPLGPGWAGVMLLARAAPLAKHADNYSTLFDIKTMRPLIDGPPFVRALEELVEAAKLSKNEGLAHDPDSARRAFWQGRCGLAVTWPTAAAGDEKSDAAVSSTVKEPSFSCTPAELPGSRDVYNIDESHWTVRKKDEEIHVPLLATSGRMGVVSQKSTNQQAAAQLLAWLSGDEFTPPLATHSSHTTMYRKSQLRYPQQWVEKAMSLDSALLYQDVAEKAFTRQDWLFALRIPGRSEYLAVLDEAVRQAVSADKPPKQILRDTAKRWNEITDRNGKQRQLSVYRKSLGLTP